MNEPEPNDDARLELPPQLADELKATFGRPPAIPAELDNRLLTEAREILGRATSSPAGRIVPFPRWLAAAAAIVVAAVVTWAPVGKRETARQVDLNGDGQLDILDSYQLARRIQQGQKLDPTLDLNGDGVVDTKDLEVLTARVVHLGREKG